MGYDPIELIKSVTFIGASVCKIVTLSTKEIEAACWEIEHSLPAEASGAEPPVSDAVEVGLS